MKKPINFFEKSFLGMLANWLTAAVSVVLIVFNTSPVNTKEENKIDLSKYRLTFADEFDGDSLDERIWGPHNHYGLRKGGYWAKDCVSVHDGSLFINTRYEEDGEFGPGWYNCGIATENKFEQKYGYFECRCKLPKGQGLWSAFWMMNRNVKAGNDASMGAEIDIFESPYYYRGGKRANLVTSNLHYNGYELQTKYRNVVISALDNDPYENFNTYGVDWSEDGYIFYVNGYEVARTKWATSHEAEYLILSCEVDGAAAQPTFGWSGKITRNPEGLDFTADFEVDYVRAYEKI